MREARGNRDQMMTLARKIVQHVTLLSAGLAFAAAGILWGVSALQRLSAVTHEEFQELRQVRECEDRVTTALELLARADSAAALAELDAAIGSIREFEDFQEATTSAVDDRHASRELTLAARVVAGLTRVRSQLAATQGAQPPADLVDALRDTKGAIEHVIDEVELAVARVHDQVAGRFWVTQWALVALFAAMIVGGVLMAVLHYRSIVGPLRRLREGAVDLASGRLKTCIEPSGYAEFVDLQRAFNHMAHELSTLCDKLEQRVAEQSKQLARSERLASVGYLAAGVAHEINNPLAIISGYTESVLRRLREYANALDSAPQLLADLEIVRDEAFRCKGITDGLLDLSRMGDLHRAPVSMKRIIEDVVGLARSTPMSQERTLSIRNDGPDDLCVSGSAPELKQVVLNLMINALRAVPPTRGRVELTATRNNGCVELRVADNGCGMAPETLAHAFEPFYSLGGKHQGVGLGLTISQTIVERHGGTLSAESPGPGKGSVFTMRIPACAETA
jgi:two-component system NtrC family sensor kinase